MRNFEGKRFFRASWFNSSKTEMIEVMAEEIFQIATSLDKSKKDILKEIVLKLRGYNPA